MTEPIDIPDEVRNDAMRTARRLGRYPKWFLDLRAGAYSGRVPGPLTPEELATIEKNERWSERMPLHRNPLPMQDVTPKTR